MARLQDREIAEVHNNEDEAIKHLKQAMAQGKHWYLALLEAIGLWTKERETVDGREFVYLIEKEALDWPALAARLCLAVDSMVPEVERDALLFRGKPPLELTRAEFSRLIGSVKYHAYLNYLYGIAVEETLLMVVEAEVRKEQRCHGYCREDDVADEAYRRIYDATQSELLAEFRHERCLRPGRSMTLTQAKQFTYWRFKYRLKHCEPAKVASDTRKGLDELMRQRSAVRLGSPDASQAELGVLLV